MQAKYKNRSMCGLKNGHEYIVKFSKSIREYVYNCHIVFDITEQEETDIIMKYASEISIKNNWDIDKLELDND